jgi:hypothetical protein
MEQENGSNGNWGSNSTKVWLGIAAGTAIGLGIALSRRQRKTKWDSAREVGQRLSDRSSELTEAATDLIGRMKTIYDEGRKVVEDAGELWAHSRKLVGY